MTSEVQVTDSGGVLVVAINRPLRRNAVNHAVAVALATAVDRLDSEAQLRVGIITGCGGHFCSGMDLKAFLDGDRPELDGRGFGGITQAPPRKPLIAAVEGFALAGGCELALACDLIVAAENAWFGLPEVTRGLVAGSGGLVRLPRRIAPAIALEYALTGDRFSAPMAHGWGLVNQLTPPGGALVGAKELAARIARNSPLAVETSKHIIAESRFWGPTEVWARQAPLVEAVVGSEDAREGARAFVEKREPQWKGR